MVDVDLPGRIMYVLIMADICVEQFVHIMHLPK
jgi:hypothetical protein